MRKIRLNILMLLLWVPLAAGCGDLLDLDINTDPDAATEVDGGLLLTTAQASIGANRSIEFGPPMAFFSQIWASDGSAGVFLDPERYVISTFTTGNTWGSFYTNVLGNLNLMEQQALEAEPVLNNVAAQAQVLKAFTFWMLTAMWEEVPYTEALDGVEFPNPNFDDQETILRGLLTDLDGAIALMETDTLGVVTGDLMYDGDMADWERFANSLKLRILMMIRNEDPSVDAQIATLLSQPLIRENSQEAAIPFFNTTDNENNVWKLNNMFGGFTEAANGNNFIFGNQVLVELMKSLGDPRLDTYFELPVEDGETVGTEHFGQQAGRTAGGNLWSSVSQNIIRRDWPERMITAAEVWFYEAEYHARNGDLAAAEAAFETGIQRAFDYFDGKPGERTEAEEAAYIASLGALSAQSQTDALEMIWEQQYIEVFDRGPENWVQVRRVGHPTLLTPVQSTLGAGQIIRRLPYPPDELSSNPNAPTSKPLDEPMWFGVTGSLTN